MKKNATKERMKFEEICPKCNIRKQLWSDYYAICPKCRKKSVLPD